MIFIAIAIGIWLGLCFFVATQHEKAGDIPSGKWYRPPYDDSDDVANNRRSGVRVITDHKTGLQYLMSPLGHLTPRMNEFGHQMRASGWYRKP
jgi:hypothetical protein